VSAGFGRIGLVAAISTGATSKRCFRDKPFGHRHGCPDTRTGRGRNCRAQDIERIAIDYLGAQGRVRIQEC